MKSFLFLVLVAPLLAGPYAIDDLPFPKGVPAEVGAIDFAPDGTFFVALRRGDVLRATPTAKVADWRWERFAGGFHNACGLDALSRDQVRVSQMAELTEASDTDGDGRADEYRVFAAGWGLSGNYHETTTLCDDGEGGYYLAVGTASHNGPTGQYTIGEYSKVGRRGRNFAAVKWRGCTLHCDARGNLTPFCYGLRMHNGIHRDSLGNLWCGDNQGDWKAATPLYHLRKGKFYGHPSSLVWDPRWPKERDPLDSYRSDLATYNKHRTWPAVQIPHQEMNRSAGEPYEIPESFPHFPGQMLLPDNNGQRITRIMLEKVNGVYQGACTHFLDTKDLRSGNHRIRFSPDGQQIYVGQTVRGWGESAEGVQRLTPKKKQEPFDIATLRILSNGFEITFTRELGRDLRKGDLSFQSFVYQPRWSYGSAPEDQFRNELSALTKTGEGKYAVSLEDFHPGRVYRLDVNGRVKSQDGERIQNTLFYYTANEVPE